jgi:hypothetical protein
MSGGSIRLRDLIRIQGPVWPSGDKACGCAGMKVTMRLFLKDTGE